MELLQKSRLFFELSKFVDLDIGHLENHNQEKPERGHEKAHSKSKQDTGLPKGEKSEENAHSKKRPKDAEEKADDIF